jgi:hypothetical protein
VVNHSVGGIMKFLNFESQALCSAKLLKEVCQIWFLKAKFGVSQLFLKANLEKAFLWEITCND